MPLTPDEQRRQQMQMFGCTEEQIDIAVNNTIMGGPLMLAGSILSDSQELLERGRLNEARQYINRAKYIIFNEHRKQR